MNGLVIVCNNTAGGVICVPSFWLITYFCIFVLYHIFYKKKKKKKERVSGDTFALLVSTDSRWLYFSSSSVVLPRHVSICLLYSTFYSFNIRAFCSISAQPFFFILFFSSRDFASWSLNQQTYQNFIFLAFSFEFLVFAFKNRVLLSCCCCQRQVTFSSGDRLIIQGMILHTFSSFYISKNPLFVICLAVVVHMLYFWYCSFLVFCFLVELRWWCPWAQSMRDKFIDSLFSHSVASLVAKRIAKRFACSIRDFSAKRAYAWLFP